ncbi:MAG: tRNA (N(6)-L-threonylcarbamoyladenosine(37)-C(2))-methylthiotransferase MtaB [candidate division Zixibacteria bacterium RBG_16_43_9]|nr:MAG: tRNA (N(6)-L-threonylcarbamoyladenosine(37)-C(2))-methylthiotransferase MtaB [candidate division Zixibacteria bacterium RBG_16_43_9]
MSQRKVALYTVGCKLNQYETEWMGESLEKAGFKRVGFSEQADLYIINTCTVTAQSDYSSRQAVYRAFRRSPDSKIAVVGCYSEVEADLLNRLPGVILVLGNEEKKRIGEVILERLYGEKSNLKEEKTLITGRFKHTRALVKIQDGCNESCSYCIVPRARGNEKSRDAREIIEEIKGLRDKGFKEVVLTGVHIGKYSQDGMNLTALLKKILSETQVERIRLSSTEPKELGEGLIRFLVEEKRICRHLHLPLQAGSNEILTRMRRNYTVEEYRDLIYDVSNRIENVTLGADVMVGFPGESEEDFEKTCGFILSSPLSYLHVFSYSVRRGTSASEMRDKLTPQVIHKRSEILHQIGKEKWEKHLERFTGKKMEILVEGTKDKKTGRLIGLTDNYIRILIDGDEGLKNKILIVNIVKREGKFLTGEIQRFQHV